MWPKSVAALAVGQLLASVSVQAAPTWPQSYDEMEDLYMLQSGYRSRGFAAAVTPCTNSLYPGFRTAAAFLRIAFHDTAAHNAATGQNGLDGSIAYELDGDFATHNVGPFIPGSLTWYGKYFNEKASMADLIALGAVTAVRSCGGPQIPLRAGRLDASGAGPDNLPDSSETGASFVARFAQMGFSSSEMIQLVACGHTLGGVHPNQNPDITSADPATAAAKNVLVFDTTDAAFDNRVVTEYLSGTTQNPLVVGNPKLRSDLKAFQVDNNSTVRQLAQTSTFMGSCQAVIGKMLEKVPSSSKLSAVIQPYDAKPGQMNLQVETGGRTLAFSTEVRIRTTTLGSIASAKLIYTPRSGDVCGPNACTLTGLAAGTTTGSGESFTFFGFSGAKIPSITSFTVVVTTSQGSQVQFNNGGSGFPVNDGAFVQASSSSLSGGNVKAVVAVRNGAGGSPSMVVTTSGTYVAGGGLPQLSKQNLVVSQVCSDSLWTYYSGTGSATTGAKLSVSVGGTVVDGFRTINFSGSGTAPKCGVSSTTASSTTTSRTSSSSTLSTTSKVSSSTSSLTSSSTSKSSSSTTTKSSSLSSSSSTTKSSSLSSSSSTTKSSSLSSSSSSTTTGKSSSTRSGQITSSTGSSSSSSSVSSSSSTTSSTTESTTESTTSSTTEFSSTTFDAGLATTTTTSDHSAATSTTTSAEEGDHATSTTTWDDAASTTWTSSWVDETSTTTSDDNDEEPPSWTAWNPVESFYPDPTNKDNGAGWATTVMDAITTYCPEPTTFYYNDKSIIVTKATTLTITDCPCTVKVPGSGSGSTGGDSDGSYNSGSDDSNKAGEAEAALSSVYQQYATKKAPNGGINGGGSRYDGLDLSNIQIATTTLTYTGVTVVFTTSEWEEWKPTATAGGAAAGGYPASATGGSPAAATTAATPGWTEWQTYVKPTATKTGPSIAKYTGAANSLARGEAVMMGAAAIVGAVAMVL